MRHDALQLGTALSKSRAARAPFHEQQCQPVGDHLFDHRHAVVRIVILWLKVKLPDGQPMNMKRNCGTLCHYTRKSF
jgi:hypothetical protein